MKSVGYAAMLAGALIAGMVLRYSLGPEIEPAPSAEAAPPAEVVERLRHQGTCTFPPPIIWTPECPEVQFVCTRSAGPGRCIIWTPLSEAGP
jgi:hypothetical protein